jgi:hypothetical protein
MRQTQQRDSLDLSRNITVLIAGQWFSRTFPVLSVPHSLQVAQQAGHHAPQAHLTASQGAHWHSHPLEPLPSSVPSASASYTVTSQQWTDAPACHSPHSRTTPHHLGRTGLSVRSLDDTRPLGEVECVLGLWGCPGTPRLGDRRDPDLYWLGKKSEGDQATLGICWSPELQIQGLLCTGPALKKKQPVPLY